MTEINFCHHTVLSAFYGLSLDIAFYILSISSYYHQYKVLLRWNLLQEHKDSNFLVVVCISLDKMIMKKIM